MKTYLDRILQDHRSKAAADQRTLEGLRAAAAAMPPCRGFAAALGAGGALRVIAEVKRRSPSKGDLHPDLDPAEVARSYEFGGATCLSVLTDVDWFGGSVEDLVAARDAVGLPVLRKERTSPCP